MLATNLLPAEQKKVVAREEARRLILFFTVIIMAIFFIAASLLLPSLLPLAFAREELERSLAIEEEGARRLHLDDVRGMSRELKSILSSVKAFNAEPSRASSLLGELLFGSGEKVVITGIATNKGGETMLSGIAETRRALLRFEQTLRESGRFQQIVSPPSNIIRESNINFVIRGQLKPRFSL